MSVRLEFKPEDMWVGAFWRSKREGIRTATGYRHVFTAYDLWVCVVPMLPLHFQWTRTADARV